MMAAAGYVPWTLATLAVFPTLRLFPSPVVGRP